MLETESEMFIVTRNYAHDAHDRYYTTNANKNASKMPRL
jgi:hypothetical protein